MRRRKNKGLIVGLFAFVLIIALFTASSIATKNSSYAITSHVVAEDGDAYRQYIVPQKESWIRNTVESIGVEKMFYKTPQTDQLYTVDVQGNILAIETIIAEEDLA